MRQSITFVSLIRLALVVLGSAAAIDCGGEAATTGAAADPVGRISLPLTATVDDHQYRLDNVYIQIYGPQYATLTSSGSTDPTLNASLQTGDYQAYLYSWTLERDDGSGNFAAVRADLISSTAAGFSIYNGSTTTIGYQFRTDGAIVTIGQGQLRVAISVDEIAPVCTPLGSDCGDGAWCPPTGLTGAPLACRSAGTVALGSSCAGPADCVANTACIDSGAGPVCAALCSSSDFDAPCVSGGTCQRATVDYGVCAPAASMP
jgi:hypothetical protein